MSLFDNAISRIFDNSRKRALSMMEEMEDVFKRFDLDNTVDSLIDRGASICDTLAEFGRTIKDTVSDFKVVVPFNEKTETFHYEVVGDTITVTVTGKNTDRKLTASIPSNCNVDLMRHVINKKKDEMVIIIPKDIANDENLQRIKDDTIKKVKETADFITKTVKDKTEKFVAETKEVSKKKVEPIKCDDKGNFHTVKIEEAPKKKKRPTSKRNKPSNTNTESTKKTKKKPSK